MEIQQTDYVQSRNKSSYKYKEHDKSDQSSVDIANPDQII